MNNNTVASLDFMSRGQQCESITIEAKSFIDKNNFEVFKIYESKGIESGIIITCKSVVLDQIMHIAISPIGTVHIYDIDKLEVGTRISEPLCKIDGKEYIRNQM